MPLSILLFVLLFVLLAIDTHSIQNLQHHLCVQLRQKAQATLCANCT